MPVMNGVRLRSALGGQGERTFGRSWWASPGSIHAQPIAPMSISGSGAGERCPPADAAQQGRRAGRPPARPQRRFVQQDGATLAPLASPTMNASAVAMNSVAQSPEDSGRWTRSCWSRMRWAAATTIRTSRRSVCAGPAVTAQPVIGMATTWTPRYADSRGELHFAGV